MVRWALAFLVLFLLTLTISLYSFQVVGPCFHLLCISCLHLSNDRSSLFIHEGLLPSLSDYLLTRMHCSWPWEKWSLNINQLSLILLTCRAHSHEIQGDPWGGLLRCSEVHGCSLTCCSAFSSSDTELHNFIVTTAKAALILCISNKTFPVCYNEVKQHTIPCGTVHRLCQELVINTFQGHPGLCGLLCRFSSRRQGSSSPA